VMTDVLRSVLIGAFGGTGAVSRYMLDRFVQTRTSSYFPFGTLTVNLIGAAALGAVDALGSISELSKLIASVLGVGFLGGFTTFSTLIYESFAMLTQRGTRLSGFANLAGSIVLGLTAYLAVFELVRRA